MVGDKLGAFPGFGSHHFPLKLMEDLKNVYQFFKLIEPLKDTLRTGITQQGRQESVAEHSWRLAVMATLICSKYFPNLNFKKVITMCLVHDLGEIINGDIPAPEQVNYPNKSEQERKDFEKVIQPLPNDLASQLIIAWDEYEEATSEEARLVKALDKLESIIQHNQGNHSPDFDHAFDLTYGKKYMDFDPIISHLRKMVDEETRKNIRRNQV